MRRARVHKIDLLADRAGCLDLGDSAGRIEANLVERLSPAERLDAAASAIVDETQLDMPAAEDVHAQAGRHVAADERIVPVDLAIRAHADAHVAKRTLGAERPPRALREVA